MSYARERQVAVELARAAGDVLLERLPVERRIDFKGATDLVTDADHAAEDVITAGLKRRFPGDALLAEESGRYGSTGEGGRLWVIDPLDGTTNYANGFPIFAVSIGLAVDGRMQAGAVHVPTLGETFSAARGEGATLNGQPIDVSLIEDLGQAILGTGFAYNPELRQQNLDYWARFVAITRAVRRVGSAAFDLCCVASGRFDGFWERGLSAWDVAAGSLIVEEAGGVTSDYGGGPLDIFGREVVAAGPALHPRVIEVLNDPPGAGH